MKEKEKNMDKDFSLSCQIRCWYQSSDVCSAQQWLEADPCPQKRQEKGRMGDRNYTSLPNQASIRLCITLYSAALI